MSCDDGDPNTKNDKINALCECIGEVLFDEGDDVEIELYNPEEKESIEKSGPSIAIRDYLDDMFGDRAVGCTSDEPVKIALIMDGFDLDAEYMESVSEVHTVVPGQEVADIQNGYGTYYASVIHQFIQAMGVTNIELVLISASSRS